MLLIPAGSVLLLCSFPPYPSSSGQGGLCSGDAWRKRNLRRRAGRPGRAAGPLPTSPPTPPPSRPISALYRGAAGGAGEAPQPTAWLPSPPSTLLRPSPTSRSRGRGRGRSRGAGGRGRRGEEQTGPPAMRAHARPPAQLLDPGPRMGLLVAGHVALVVGQDGAAGVGAGVEMRGEEEWGSRGAPARAHRCMRLAFADSLSLVCDPLHAPVPLDSLLSKRRALSQAKKILANKEEAGRGWCCRWGRGSPAAGWRG